MSIITPILQKEEFSREDILNLLSVEEPELIEELRSEAEKVLIDIVDRRCISGDSSNFQMSVLPIVIIAESGKATIGSKDIRYQKSRLLSVPCGALSRDMAP